MNLQGRSLLSLSVAHLDDSIELTRVLINHGARVWPELEPAAAHPPSSCSEGAGLRTVAEITRDTETSAFTWLLRAVINQRGLENTGRSVECLAHLMGRHPDRMKAHVTRVMLRSVHSHTVTQLYSHIATYSHTVTQSHSHIVTQSHSHIQSHSHTITQ